MKNISDRLRLFLVLLGLFLSSRLSAFPDQEIQNIPVSSSLASAFVAQSDQFLFVGFSNTIQRFDTQTFELTADQMAAFSGDNSDTTQADLGGSVEGMAVRGSTLFVSQSDGDLVSVDLNNITATPTAVHVADGALGPIAADTSSSSNDQVYVLSPSTNAVLVYDISNQSVTTSIPLVDGIGTPVSPEAIAFVPIGSSGKIYVTSSRGLIYDIAPGGTSVSNTIAVSTSDKDLKAVAGSPNGDFVLVTDNTDNAVHVIDTSTDAEQDMDSVTAGTNPLLLTQNSSLSSIVVTDVSRPDDTYAYVAGSSGVSVIDLNLTSGQVSTSTVIDFNDTGSGDTADDPLTLSSAPDALIASSVSDGYVYASDNNGSLSVITDKPLVEITGDSLNGGTLTTGASFNITFQTSVTGTYRVVAGGDSSGNGTEIASGTVDTANVDVTTSDIAFDSSLFQEGPNRVFVFVTDTTSGLIGRDAEDVTVNSPPQGIEIVGTDFGDQKIFVTFKRLTANDIDHYNIYIDTDSAAVATKTDAAGAESQPTSGDTVKVKIVGLVNGTTYFVGIEGVDSSGNVGTRGTTFSDGTPASATPEHTVGLAEAVGETGCTLIASDGGVSGSGAAEAVFVFVGIAVLLMVRRGRGAFFFLSLCAVLIAASVPASANQTTPQWFSLEVKGGVWIPMNSTTRGSLGTFGPTGAAEFGFLYHRRYGAELGVGFVPEGGTAFGATSGKPSGDRFDLLLIPIQNSFAFRADFRDDQLFVPYVKAGPDYVFFHESLNGASTNGLKFGLHGAVGLQILLDRIDPLSDLMEKDLGVNGVYFTIEGRYAWINNFGGSGLDLSNLTATGGLLFEF